MKDEVYFFRLLEYIKRTMTPATVAESALPEAILEYNRMAEKLEMVPDSQMFKGSLDIWSEIICRVTPDVWKVTDTLMSPQEAEEATKHFWQPSPWAGLPASPEPGTIHCGVCNEQVQLGGVPCDKTDCVKKYTIGRDPCSTVGGTSMSMNPGIRQSKMFVEMKPWTEDQFAKAPLIWKKTDPEIGYLREDGDGHWYAVPENEVESFDNAQTAIETAKPDSEEWYDLVDEFQARFDRYRLSGGPYDIKVIIPDK